MFSIITSNFPLSIFFSHFLNFISQLFSSLAGNDLFDFSLDIIASTSGTNNYNKNELEDESDGTNEVDESDGTDEVDESDIEIGNYNSIP